VSELKVEHNKATTYLNDTLSSANDASKEFNVPIAAFFGLPIRKRYSYFYFIIRFFFCYTRSKIELERIESANK
jgi:hypothetical protein